MLSRERWGAAPFTGVDQTLGTAVEIVIHHSVTDSSVKEIQQFHKEYRGWSDVGYHFVIAIEASGPVIYEGRELFRRGAHAPPNEGRIGICVVGNFDLPQAEVSQTLKECLTALCSELLVHFPTIHTIRPHGLGYGGKTCCPGRHLAPVAEALNRQFGRPAPFYRIRLCAHRVSGWANRVLNYLATASKTSPTT